ncbi:MAG: hypothetical protein J6V36_05375 [Clostridia bacterium]|nr:hypothetical protein [Clostridia bacterium]
MEENNKKVPKIVDGKKNYYGTIPKTFRGHISSFGAAVTMGSFKAAVAFFSQQAGAKVERHALLETMYYITNITDNSWKSAQKIAEEIINKTDKAEINKMKDDFINASLALKLAMNAFELVEKK